MRQTIKYYDNNLKKTLTVSGLILHEQELKLGKHGLKKVYEIENEDGLHRLMIDFDGTGFLLKPSPTGEEKLRTVTRLYLKTLGRFRNLEENMRNLIHERDFYKDEALRSQPK